MTPTPPPLIVHVIHHLVMGGMENGLINLINHIPASAYRHAVVCIEDYSDFRLRIRRPDVEVIALSRSQVGVYRVRMELYKLMRRLRPAIVHSRNLSGLDALLPARLAGVGSCVHSEHGWDVDNLHGQSWRPRLLRRLHAPLVDRFITVSKDLERFLVSQVGIHQARISQIYNGVDTERFSPASGAVKSRDFLPPELRGDDLFVIGTVGRLEPVKDQASLLHAFATLRAQDPALRARARLVVAGGGPLQAELAALAQALGVADSTWFAGPVGNVPELMRGLDLFVLPSKNEGLSNTILEAMACGVPVVATAVGGNVELIEDGQVGRLYTSGDRDALTGHLHAYAADPATRRAHAEAGRLRVVRDFSIAAMVDGYRAVYDELAQRRGAPRPA